MSRIIRMILKARKRFIENKRPNIKKLSVRTALPAPFIGVLYDTGCGHERLFGRWAL